MTCTPKVSVVINAYNYERFIAQSIESVLAQTLSEVDRELIVVDDGSVDGTCSIVGKYGERVCYIRKANGGQASAFNTGVAAARGRIICFLDADDYYYPEKLQRIVDEFGKRPGVGVLYNRYDVVDVAGVRRSAGLPKSMPQGEIGARILLGYTSGCPSSGISVRREIVAQVRIPEEPFRISADYFYLNVLPLLTRVGFVGETLHAYRMHGSNLYMGRPSAEKLQIHEAQRGVLWGYASQELKKEFFQAEHELRTGGRASILARLGVFARGMRYLLYSDASTALRLWSMFKLAARLVMSPSAFTQLKELRDRLLLWTRGSS